MLENPLVKSSLDNSMWRSNISIYGFIAKPKASSILKGISMTCSVFVKAVLMACVVATITEYSQTHNETVTEAIIVKSMVIICKSI